MKKLISLSVLFFTLSYFSYGQIEESYKEALKEFFEVSGKFLEQQEEFKQMSLKFKGFSEVPQLNEEQEKIFDSIAIQMSSNESKDLLVELSTPVYNKYFSLENLEDLITFYKTPIGKKKCQEHCYY